MDYEAVIIGTGFGGAITACRLGKKWKDKVLVLERGKRYPKGSFPRSPEEWSRSFWNRKVEKINRPKSMRKKESHGFFDIRSYNNMDIVLSAGVGGGSLIYANIFMEPPQDVFAEGWPKGISLQSLQPYYQIVKRVLGSRPVPAQNEPRRKISKLKYFQDTAKKMGMDSKLADLNVFFGNDFDNPTPIGVQEKNRFGALQTSCTYCAECDIGCNIHAKNTLDLNYLFVAEQDHKVKLLTEHLVYKIVPLNASGSEDPSADGQHGYIVYIEDLRTNEHKSVKTQRVVVSAGTLGTNELLMRCKYKYKTLCKISDKIGQNFSGNGDFLSAIFNTNTEVNPTYGPVITQRIDHKLFSNFDRNQAFIMEDASYPSILAWFVEGEKPGFMKISGLLNALKHLVSRLINAVFSGRGLSVGRMGFAFADLLKNNLSQRTSIHLCMGIDKSNGIMSLGDDGKLQINWPYKDSMPLYKAINKLGKKFQSEVNGECYVPLPTWNLKRNVSVHPLGGCILSDTPETGVCNTDPNYFGELYNYRNLFAADGSIVPTAVGANPTATISALCEKVAEGITKIPPTDELK